MDNCVLFTSGNPNNRHNPIYTNKQTKNKEGLGSSEVATKPPQRTR